MAMQEKLSGETAHPGVAEQLDMAPREPSLDSQQKEELAKAYPSGPKVALILISMYLAVFLVALVDPRCPLAAGC